MVAKKPRVIGGIKYWRCPRCKRWKTSDCFYPSKRTPNGIKSSCKKCEYIDIKRTCDPVNSRRLNRESMRRCKARNPEATPPKVRKPEDPIKRSARRKFAYAVSSGRITRPTACSECGCPGSECSGSRICGHHADYSKPFDVEWLCDECHGRRHWKPVLKHQEAKEVTE